MTNDPQFPNYQNPVTVPAAPASPVPQGIPFIHEKYHKPLYKLMKSMLKPKRSLKRTGRQRKKRLGS